MSSRALSLLFRIPNASTPTYRPLMFSFGFFNRSSVRWFDRWVQSPDCVHFAPSTFTISPISPAHCPTQRTLTLRKSDPEKREVSIASQQLLPSGIANACSCSLALLHISPPLLSPPFHHLPPPPLSTINPPTLSISHTTTTIVTSSTLP